ncbi:MAG: hypothetical protein AAFN41_08060 [Planctomycetota bacterium]
MAKEPGNMGASRQPVGDAPDEPPLVVRYVVAAEEHGISAASTLDPAVSAQPSGEGDSHAATAEPAAPEPLQPRQSDGPSVSTLSSSLLKYWPIIVSVLGAYAGLYVSLHSKLDSDREKASADLSAMAKDLGQRLADLDSRIDKLDGDFRELKTRQNQHVRHHDGRTPGVTTGGVNMSYSFMSVTNSLSRPEAAAIVQRIIPHLVDCKPPTTFPTVVSLKNNVGRTMGETPPFEDEPSSHFYASLDPPGMWFFNDDEEAALKPYEKCLASLRVGIEAPARSAIRVTLYPEPPGPD